MSESQTVEYKSIRKVRTKHPDWSGLAKECVGFANAQGGYLYIGVEDNTCQTPEDQAVTTGELSDVIRRINGNTENVTFGSTTIEDSPNGGQYMSIQVLPSKNVLAATTQGKTYLRVSEESLPISGQDLTTLAAEKSDFQWELECSGLASLNEADPEKIKSFLQDIRSPQNQNVSSFVKEKSEEELLRHFHFMDGEALTNLGVLWIGTSSMRAKLRYPATAQYLVYDEAERKVRKEVWRACDLNPKELILAIEQEAVELTYSYEIPQGLFRERVPHYQPEIIRELLVNAFAHQRLTLSSDVFIEVYPDRLTISSPGGLPIGVTTKGILHERFRRNPHLMTVMEALGLMEGEGSGYDLVYEKLCMDGKALPQFENEFSHFKVTVSSKVIDASTLGLIDYASQHFELRQKDLIVLGIIARERKITSVKLTQVLGLADNERLTHWTGKLHEKEIIEQHGSKKAAAYVLSPTILSSAGMNLPPTLKTMEPHALDALVVEDLKHNPDSTMAEISKRIPDLERKDIEKSVRRLRRSERVEAQGARKNMRYKLC